MILRSFVKNNLLFRIMDPLKRKSPGYFNYAYLNVASLLIIVYLYIHRCAVEKVLNHSLVKASVVPLKRF